MLAAVLVVALAASTVPCTVTDATLTWGVKESFRSYISGSIANGEWTVSNGATYETPAFGFSDGSGIYEQEGGDILFDGAITFTGHGDILNTTVANPRIDFIDADTAALLLDVSGTTQEGAAVDRAGVEFVELDLSKATVTRDGDTLVMTDVPAHLTADGATAFGTYEAGEEFDPVSFTLPLDASCSASSFPSTPSTGWIWLLGGTLLYLAVWGLVELLQVHRTRKNAAS